MVTVAHWYPRFWELSAQECSEARLLGRLRTVSNGGMVEPSFVFLFPLLSLSQAFFQKRRQEGIKYFAIKYYVMA